MKFLIIKYLMKCLPMNASRAGGMGKDEDGGEVAAPLCILITSCNERLILLSLKSSVSANPVKQNYSHQHKN